MIRDAAARFPDAASSVLEEASCILEADVQSWKHTDVPLDTNQQVQIGLFISNHIYLLGVIAQGIAARWSAGLSLGEFNHLVHIGALSFPDALRLVARRGGLYDEAPVGMLAAVFPLDLEELQPVVDAFDGVVSVALCNAPTQHVIAGEPAAVQNVLDALESAFFIETRVLSTPIAPHTMLFSGAEEGLRPALDAAPWQSPRLPYRPNVTGRFCSAPLPNTLADLLQRQCCGTVQWRTTIETLDALGEGIAFVEVGPSKVLSGLLRRSWIRRPSFCTQEDASFQSALEVLGHGG